VQSDLIADQPRLQIKIVNHFHMVTNKPDRGNYYVVNSAHRQLPEVVTDIRAQPWLRWWSTATLKNKLPFLHIQSLRYQPAGFPELVFIFTVLRHCERNAVSSKN